MMKKTTVDQQRVVDIVAGLFECMTVAHTQAKRATVFLSSNYTVKLTRPHKHDKRSRGYTLLLTYGRPNYAERQFYKAYEKRHGQTPEGATFIKDWPKPKAKKGKK